jgi:uncharacterized protein (TIGR00251 family)
MRNMTDSPTALDLRQTPEGTVLKVKVSAGARRNAIGGVHAGRLRVSVTTAPEKGKANRTVIALLAAALGIAPRDLQLISGELTPHKQFLVRGQSANEVRGRLDPSNTDGP